MKVDELMVGDLVYYSYPNQFVTKVIDVCSHGEEPFIRCQRDIKDNLYEPGKFDDFHVGILRPIPLTQKILEQNGFLEVDKDKVKETATHVYLYMEDGEPEDGFAICGNDEYGYYLGVKLYKEPYHIFVGKYRASKDPNLMSYVYPTYNVKYVHKLQHILKDFEIEKKIIL